MVSSCAPILKCFYAPQFFPYGKFVPKITNFDEFGMRVRTITCAKFCFKNRLRDLPHIGKFMSKLSNFDDFGGINTIFVYP